MIIKSHVRGGYRSAAEYLKEIGENEKVRLVEISDPDADNLDDAFKNMWTVGSTTRARKPLHHVSINPYKDERLTDGQVRRICARLEQKYGYRFGEHQRVIVEHVKNGRQHFHVMWNRVSLRTGRPVWPGHHWNKSKQAAREMEMELGLKRLSPRRAKARTASPYKRAQRFRRTKVRAPIAHLFQAASYVNCARHSRARGDDKQAIRFYLRRPQRVHYRRTIKQPPLQLPAPQPYRPTWYERLIAWAWENRRADILARFGIHVSFDL